MIRPLLILILSCLWLASSAQEATIIDSRHYSHIFGEMRNLRIFFPPGYSKDKQKRYPVIYFFHGWGQRYFGEGGEEQDHARDRAMFTAREAADALRVQRRVDDRHEQA